MASPPDPTQATVTAALGRLQAVRGWLSDDSLRELAADLSLPLSRLEEVASFFPHFRRRPPPPVEVGVCRDLACHRRGADALTDRLEKAFGKDQRVAVGQVSCLGRCDRPVACVVNRNGGPGEHVHDALYLGRPGDELARVVRAAVDGLPLPRPDTDADLLPALPRWQIDAVADAPPFRTAQPLADRLRRADATEAGKLAAGVLAQVKASGLLGMGGGQEEAGKKWTDVAGRKTTVKYVVANGDESEPGTFKDRDLLLRHPNLVVEGVILAGVALRATRGYIFIRHEYTEQIAAVRRAISVAEAAGACGDWFPVTVFVSPGGYICGEQSALIEAMEGNRGQPRNKPPTLATNGLFDQPTLVSNVETFSWVPGIVRHTADPADPTTNWYGGPGAKGQGRRLFSLCGDVVRPGVYELPRGTPLRGLLDAAGGVVGGEDRFLALAPSGPSGGFAPRKLTARGETSDLLDLPLEKDAFGKKGLLLGSGLMVYARGADLPAAASNATNFYRNESCGKCVPCRVGSQKLVEIGRQLVGRKLPREEREATTEAVAELDAILRLTSICSLGPSASQPLLTLLKAFPEAVGERGG